MRIVYVIAPSIALVLILVTMLFVTSIETPRSVHCSDCPSKTCLCIQDNTDKWMLSPEVGDVDEGHQQ
jgi:hypothetical protein